MVRISSVFVGKCAILKGTEELTTLAHHAFPIPPTCFLVLPFRPPTPAFSALGVAGVGHRRIAIQGVGCQKAQKAITELCYHESFSADAVLMKRPLRAKSSKGRTFVFPSKSTSGSGDAPVKVKIKRGRETDFVRRRNDLVERTFVPRWGRLISSGGVGWGGMVLSKYSTVL